MDKIRKLKNRTGIVIQPVLNKEQPVSLTGNLILHEVVVLPSSDLSGVTVRDIDFEESFGAVFLGARSRKGLHNKLIGDWKLASGDCMLLASTKDKTKTMHKYFPDLFIINHTDYSDFTPKCPDRQCDHRVSNSAGIPGYFSDYNRCISGVSGFGTYPDC